MEINQSTPVPESAQTIARSRRTPRRALPIPGHSGASAVHDVFSGLLYVERQNGGTTVTGPGVYVWDSNHEEAIHWALQLTRALRKRRERR
jgi:hypothetical protein